MTAPRNPTLTDLAVVLVDMQELFTAARFPSVISGCQSLLRWAGRENLPVLPLMYVDYGNLVAPVKGALDRCGAALPAVWKLTDDGGAETLEALDLHGLRPKRLLIAGVQTHACVLETAASLSRRFQVIPVVEACGSVSNHDPMQTLSPHCSVFCHTDELKQGNLPWLTTAEACSD